MAEKATLYLAGEYTLEEIDSIIARFQWILAEEIEFDIVRDESFIGGFVAHIGGKVYDASIKTKLGNLARHLGAQTKDGILVYDQQAPVDNPVDGMADAGSITGHIRRMLDSYQGAYRVYEYGQVVQVADGVIRIDGLTTSMNNELLELDHGIYGMAIDLSEDGVGAVLLNGMEEVRVGDMVRGTGMVMQAPIGPSLLGRVVDPIGRPMDGELLTIHDYRPIEMPAPKILDRSAVDTPMETGILAIDSMIPIGRGQRELIIGDRQTGKTTIALDAVINQVGKNVFCVYVAIGQKASTIANVVETLRQSGALSHTVVVASTASDCVAMQYIAPYAGCAIAEGFMYQGKDVLIVYDDLSKHAVSYRTMSLLLHRPVGREAYPGDVFYLHSRLLERAAKLSQDLGGGSITALPIIETMAGDISAYIPTNVISITDGQIYLETEMFRAGLRPAINVGLSVSRVGRAAQYGAMKRVSGTLRLDLAQYREMAVFSQFGSDIDAPTQRMLDRGERLTQAVRQAQRQTFRLSQQVVVLLAFTGDYMQDVPANQIVHYREGLLSFVEERRGTSMAYIDQEKELDASTQASLTQVIREFSERWGA